MTEIFTHKGQKSKNITIVLLALFICMALIFVNLNLQFKQSEAYDTSKRPALNLLFIGNSYTFVNNMPDMIKILAEHDPNAHFRIETEMFVAGGATLGHLASQPTSMTILTKKQWDYVILQPQSLWATSNDKAHFTDVALSLWIPAIERSGAKPIFFMTWPRQPNTHWYGSPEYTDLKSPFYMHQRTKANSEFLARKHNLLIAPIGEYWVHATENHPKLNIYDKDGTHPTPEGSLLTALVFYKMFVNSTLDDITYYPSFTSERERQAIVDIAKGTLH